MKVIDKKLAIEEDFKSWIQKDVDRLEKYGSALDLINDAYHENKNIELNRIYLNEAIFMGSEIMYWSFKMHRAISKLPKEKKERNRALRKIKKEAIEFYKNYSHSIDQELFGAMLEMYYYNVPESQHAPIFKKIENQLFGFRKLDFDWYAKMTFKKSIFASKEKFLKFLKNPYITTIKRDPAYKTIILYIVSILNKYHQKEIAFEKNLKRNRLFIAGIREMNPEKNIILMQIQLCEPLVVMLEIIILEKRCTMIYTTIDGVMQKKSRLAKNLRSQIN